MEIEEMPDQYEFEADQNDDGGNIPLIGDNTTIIIEDELVGKELEIRACHELNEPIPWRAFLNLAKKERREYKDKLFLYKCKYKHEQYTKYFCVIPCLPTQI